MLKQDGLKTKINLPTWNTVTSRILNMSQGEFGEKSNGKERQIPAEEGNTVQDTAPLDIVGAKLGEKDGNSERWSRFVQLVFHRTKFNPYTTGFSHLVFTAGLEL